MQRNGDDVEESLEELVRRAKEGDRAAFASLIQRFERTALSVAYGALGDAHLAGDVTQEAFLKAWRRLGDLKEDARFGSWFCGIVRNLAIDHRRRLKVRSAVDPQLDEARHVVDPASVVDEQERREHVRSALESLDEVTRMIVVLRYYEGLSSKQIGERMELSPGAVDMRLTRARQALHEKLKPAIDPEHRRAQKDAVV